MTTSIYYGRKNYLDIDFETTNNKIMSNSNTQQVENNQALWVF